jgi:MFS family permease
VIGPLRSRPFLAVLAATLAAFGGYALLLPVLPLWAGAGGAAPGAAGAVTGVFMAATVVSQLGVPTLLRRVGHRAALAIGCLALGLPAALLPLSSALPALFGVAVVRGVGFGVLTVAGAALVADLVPPAVRGRATGVYGVALGLPQLVLLPGSVWAWTVLGPTPVLLVGAALPLLALPALRLLPRRVVPAGTPPEVPAEVPSTPVPARSGAATPPPPTGVRALRRAAGPWLVMVVCAASAGGVITVLPLAGAGTASAVALFALTAAQLLGRSVSGEVADRRRPGRVTPWALLVVAAGAGVVALGADTPVAVVAGAALVGLGFGGVQNDTLVTLFARAGPSGSGRASTVWNTAYDTGTGLGATALAAVLGAAGTSASFLVAAVACVVALPAALAGTRPADPHPADRVNDAPPGRSTAAGGPPPPE